MSAFIWFVSKTPRMPRCFPQIWFLGQALWRGEDKRILRLPCLLFNDTCDSSGAVNFLQNLNKLIDECFFPHAKPCRDLRGSSSTDGLNSHQSRAQRKKLALVTQWGHDKGLVGCLSYSTAHRQHGVRFTMMLLCTLQDGGHCTVVKVGNGGQTVALYEVQKLAFIINTRGNTYF